MSTLVQLGAEYGSWLAKHGYPDISADELRAKLYSHVCWLDEFIQRWEYAERAEQEKAKPVAKDKRIQVQYYDVSADKAGSEEMNLSELIEWLDENPAILISRILEV
jgi:hypothetical protein